MEKTFQTSYCKKIVSYVFYNTLLNWMIYKNSDISKYGGIRFVQIKRRLKLMDIFL